jgi:hypothetical protein
VANSASCVCSLGGFSFRRPWVLKLGTYASLSKVNKIDTTEQLIEDGVIGFGEGVHLSEKGAESGVF